MRGVLTLKLFKKWVRRAGNNGGDGCLMTTNDGTDSPICDDGFRWFCFFPVMDFEKNGTQLRNAYDPRARLASAAVSDGAAV